MMTTETDKTDDLGNERVADVTILILAGIFALLFFTGSLWIF